MAACLWVCTSVVRNSQQWSEHVSSMFGRQDPRCLPSLQLAVFKVLRPVVSHHGCDGDGQVLLSYVLITVINCNLPSRYSPRSCLQETPEFQNRQILPVQLLSRQGDRFVVFLILPSTSLLAFKHVPEADDFESDFTMTLSHVTIKVAIFIHNAFIFQTEMQTS